MSPFHCRSHRENTKIFWRQLKIAGENKKNPDVDTPFHFSVSDDTVNAYVILPLPLPLPTRLYDIK